MSDLASDAGGAARALQREWLRAEHKPLSRDSIKAYLKGMALRYKRCRF